MKSLQDILSAILGPMEDRQSFPARTARKEASSRRIAARTLEDRILYSVTPLMLDDGAIQAEVAHVSADTLAMEATETASVEIANGEGLAKDSDLIIFNQEVILGVDAENESVPTPFLEACFDGAPGSSFSPFEFGNSTLLPNQVSPAESADSALQELDRLIIDDQSLDNAPYIATNTPSDGEPTRDAAEIVLIDSRLDDAEALAAAARSGAVLLTFDSEAESAEDVLSRLTEWAESSQHRISSLSILSHGAEGGFQFGADFVTTESLRGMENAWRELAEHFTEDADLAIYGCNVAASESGQNLLLRLAELTGADVAGSDNLTGGAELGGDWNFEFFTSTPAEFTSHVFSGAPVWNHALATITVTTFTDENNGDTSSITALQSMSGGSGISLREAIIAANNTAGDDTIILAAGTYTLTIMNTGGSQEEAGATGDIDFTSNITLVGAGIGLTTIDGGSIDRVLDVNSAATVNISDLKITGGHLSSGSGGSGLFVQHTGAIVSLTRVDVNGNGGANGFTGSGVYNNGTLSIADSLIRNNVASNSDGGGIRNAGTLTVARSSIVANSATNGAGFLQTAGTSTFTNVTISGNTSTYDGAGMQVTGGTVNVYYSTIAANNASQGNGGGIFRSGGVVNVQSSIFGDNASMHGGKDLHGAITSLGFNVIENYSGITTHGTDSLFTDAALAARTQDGASGQYAHAISSGSAALGKGGGTAPSTDIRSVVRGSSPDAGSYEANAAPVLSTAPVVTLLSIDEDAAAPAGAVGTLISSLVDAQGGGGWDNVSDQDGATNLGIAITAAATTNGTWYYTIDGGANWLAMGSVSGSTSRLLAADANTRIYFRPTTANYNGTIASAITFRAWDQSTGTNGGTASTTANGGTTAFSTSSETASITVNAVNDAPVLTLSGYSGSFTEGGAAIYDPGATVSDVDSADFSGGSLTYSVASGGGNGDVLSVRHVGTGAGQIGVSGNSITYGGVVIGTTTGNGDATTPMVVTFNSNASVAAVQALARNVTYQNTSDNPGTSTRTFNITISDGDGGTSTPAVVNVTMTAVNDAPVNSTPGSQSVNEDATLVFSSNNGNLISISDLDANSSLMRVTLTGTNGAITLSTTSGLSFSTGDGTADGSMTFTGTVANINSALSGMSFTAAANFNGAASIQIVTNDQGNSGTGGALSDTDTINITVNSVNDAPTGADKTIATNEDTAYTLTASDFGFHDASDSPENTLSAVKITTIPGAGSLTLNGVAVTAGQLVSAANINSGLLVWTPAANANGASNAAFTFQVQDDGGTANGGLDLDQSANTITFNVAAINDEQVFAVNAPLTVAENSSNNVIDSSHLQTTDVDNANSQLIYTISSATTNGALRLNGVALSSGNTFTQADINAGLVTYDHDGSETNSDSFGFSVDDGAGTTSSGTFTITVTPVNDHAPVITSNGGGAAASISIYENFTAVTTLTATDGDLPSPTLTYSIIGGADAAKFAVNSSTGALTFLVAPDYEAPTDAGGDNIYDVIVQASDGTLFDTQAIAISIMDSLSTLIVTTTADTNDTGLGNSFTIEQLNASKGADGHISLREAIIAANNTLNSGGADVISFNIPLSDGGFTGIAGVNGHFVIQFTTALPAITEALIIDGATQTTAQGDTNPGMLGGGGGVGVDGTAVSQVARPEIAIVGKSGLAAGFDVSANDVTIRGLGIRGFVSGAGIRINNGFSGTIIEGNLFGSNVDSLSDPGAPAHNTYHVQALGGDSGIVRDNLFAFADSTGVFLSTSSDNWLIERNQFTDNGISYSNGDAIAANGSSGLTIRDNRITGTSTQAIILSGTTNNVWIENNTIMGNGVGPAGSPTSQSDAIAIRTGVSNVTIYRNIIADNYGAGVTVNNGATGVLISQNAMYGNGTILSRNGSAATGQVDIDLQSASDNTSLGSAPYYTANDAGDGDSGGNNLQNFPVITSAQSTGSQITLGGAINSTPNSTIRIEFFANTAPGASGYGGGRRYLGFADVTTDGAGNATFNTTLAVSTNASEWVTATATDLATHCTSEFSANIAINEAPVTAIDLGPLSYIENAGSVLIAPSAAVQDDDLLDFSGAQLVVQLTSNGAAEDHLSIRNQGSAAGQVGVSGTDITYGGVIVGAYGGPVTGGTAMTITFNASATSSAVAAVLANVTYENLSDDPSTAPRTFSAYVTDGDGGVSETVTRTILPTKVNDAPDGADKTITTNEDALYTLSANDFGFTDAIDSPANSLSAVKITTLPGAGSLTLNGVAVTAGQTISVANINSGLLVFSPTANANGAGYSSFTFQVQDDGGTANGGADLDASPNTITFDVSEVNDAPIASVPGAQTTPTNVPLLFSSANGNLISIGDLDSASGPVQVQLSASDGVLTLSGVTGLTFVSGANGSGAMTISGTVANMNAALAGMSYTPDAGFGGAANLSLVVNDLGNVGAGGPLSDSESIAITVGTPGIVVTPTSSLTTSEGGATAGFTIVLSSRPTADVTINLHSTDTTEGAINTSSVTFTASNWNIAQTITVTGLQDYTNDGDTAFSIVISPALSTDLNYSGVDPADVAIVNLEMPNQAPVNHLPIHVSVNEDALLTLAGAQALSISDGDAGGNALRVSLSSAQGVFSLSRTTGLSFSLGDGQNDSAMQFEGTISDINAALDGLTFLAAPNFNGLAQLSLTTNDLGNSGAGGAQQDADMLSIFVTPVNDRPYGAADRFQPSNSRPLVMSPQSLLANDGDIDSASLSIVLLTQPQFGSVVQSADGGLVYLPDIENRMLITFQYAVFDGAALSDPITVTLEPQVLAPLPTPQKPQVSVISPEVTRTLESSSTSNSNQGSEAPMLAQAASSDNAENFLLDEDFVASDDLSMAAQIDEFDDDSDTGLWVEESRQESDRLFSIFAGALNRSGASTLTSINTTERSYDDIDLPTMGAMLERMRSDMESNNLEQHYTVGAVTVGTASIAAGYVFWALRGAQASAMLLSATPTWASFDLLPVLAGGFVRKREKEDGESLGEIATEAAMTPRESRS